MTLAIIGGMAGAALFVVALIIAYITLQGAQNEQRK